LRTRRVNNRHLKCDQRKTWCGLCSFIRFISGLDSGISDQHETWIRGLCSKIPFMRVDYGLDSRVGGFDSGIGLHHTSSDSKKLVLEKRWTKTGRKENLGWICSFAPF